jgi:hypothetical protein
LVAEFNALEQELSGKDKDHAALQELATQMKAAGITDFSGVTIEEITEKVNATKTSAAERKIHLDKVC